MQVETIRQILEATGVTFDVVGVLAIVLAAAIASARFLLFWREPGSYYAFRHALGRGIILGLEFLVAADIIRTVAIDPTLQNVSVLGLIVVIRTFLSFALEVELEGWPPWQHRNNQTAGLGRGKTSAREQGPTHEQE